MNKGCIYIVRFTVLIQYNTSFIIYNYTIIDWLKTQNIVDWLLFNVTLAVLHTYSRQGPDKMHTVKNVVFEWGYRQLFLFPSG
jgi:hypothetical protein